MTIYEICLLHSKADRAVRMQVAKQLEPASITMMQWLLMMTVKAGPAAGMRMSELAAALDVTMPQITALMNDLAKRRLVKQNVNSSDRRSRRLTITATGKQLIEDITPKVENSMKRWFGGIPAAAFKDYLTTSNKLSSLR